MELDFKSLPESMESDELEVYFRQFLDHYESRPCTLEALRQLYEIAYRQWDTYEALDSEIEKRVSDYVLGACDFTSYDITDVVISIVENLTLRDVFRYMTDNLDHVQNPAVRGLIEEAKDEYGDIIDDPFSLDDDFI